MKQRLYGLWLSGRWWGKCFCVESSEKCTGCLRWFPTVWPQRAALPHSLSHSHAEDKWQRHGVSGDWEWGGWGMWLANKNGSVTVWVQSNQRPEQSLMDTFNIYEGPFRGSASCPRTLRHAGGEDRGLNPWPFILKNQDLSASNF